MSDVSRGAVCFYSSLPDRIVLSDDLAGGTTWVTLTRTGEWDHPTYKRFSITPDTLARLIENFQLGTYGQKIFIDVGHNPDGGNAGEIVQLRVEGNLLRGQIAWTPWGRKQVSEKGYRYFSVDFSDDWKDPETGQRHGPVLMGAALTTRPFVKRLDPIELSDEFSPPSQRVLMHQELRRQLSEHVENVKMHWLKKLEEKFRLLKLSETVIKQLLAAAKQAATHLGEDEKALKALSEQFEATGKTLAESVGSGEVTLNIQLPESTDAGDQPTQLTEQQIGEIVARQLAESARQASEAQAQQTERLAERQRTLSEAFDAAENLSDEQRRELTEQVSDLLTPDMPLDAVRKLAEYQLAQAQRLSAAQQLADLGYQDSRSGSPRISVDDQGTVRNLSEQIRSHLRQTSSAQFGGLRLPEKEGPFLQRVLAEFDRLHMPAYDRERRQLSGEVSVDSSTDLPASFKREVIREALSDLNILSLLHTLTDFGATTTVQIPYEQRDAASILNDGIVYEGAGIPAAGIQQRMDTAYVVPMKLAMNLTNEVIHFTRASAINWDAFGRNVESNARIIRELLQRRVANELQRAADAYMAADVSDENISSALDGSTSQIKLAQYPLVRPRQVRDIAGNAIGSEENPITIVADTEAIEPWDGSGTQSAGIYYRVADYNLGYIQFVDEAGDPATPDPTAATISYSYATNVLKWDSDVSGSDTIAEHYDGLLRAVGSRKAVLDGERQTTPDFLLTSPVLEDEITNAKGFVPITARAGSAANDATGDLQRIKGLPAFTSNAPGLDMGDSRIIIGQRGVGAYAITKPWQVGQPFEAVNAQGQPVGRKVAYGEEYNAVHVPTPVRSRLTSVLVYSGNNR